MRNTSHTDTANRSPKRPRVLLVAGASGVGKTTLSLALARSHGVNWLQVDDLRLAFEASQIAFADDTANAAFDLLRTLALPADWQAEDARDWLIAVGRAMSDAIAIVAANHIVQNNPVVMEGDAILPEVLNHPRLQPFVADGDLQMVLIAPESETALLHARMARGRDGAAADDERHRRAAAMNWAYAQWLAHEARIRDIPVIPASPLDTLFERVAAYAPSED